MGRGLPPSYDRIVFRRRLVIGYMLAVFAIVGFAFFLFPEFLGTPQDFDPAPYQEEATPKTELEMSELASAFQAVQQAVLDRLGPQYLKEVKWLERRHQGHWGWYSYEGRLGVVGRRGQERSFEYVVVVQLSPDGEWEVLSITVE